MKSLMFKLVTDLISVLCIGERRLNILIFHRVIESYDFMRPDEITSKEFDEKMQLLTHYFTPLPLSEAVEKLKNNTLPKRAICVTFDDGYRDNAEVAFPILKKWDIPATFFIASGVLDKKIMWNDKVIETVRRYKGEILDLSNIGLGHLRTATKEQKLEAARFIIKEIKYNHIIERDRKVSVITSHVDTLQENMMMNVDHIKHMNCEGIEIGAHTVNHPILSKLSKEEAESEILNCKIKLEKIIKKEVTSFAYPNGVYKEDFSDEHVVMVEKLGFKLALSADKGINRRKDNVFMLCRFTPWNRSKFKFCSRLVLNYMGF